MDRKRRSSSMDKKNENEGNKNSPYIPILSKLRQKYENHVILNDNKGLSLTYNGSKDLDSKHTAHTYSDDSKNSSIEKSQKTKSFRVKRYSNFRPKEEKKTTSPKMKKCIEESPKKKNKNCFLGFFGCN